ncbi:MAG TPA: dienelactone hydrolase family protein [Acidimicrobiales bacterium]|nr:dienelactone hydrolase family protein [Acidimicrobiales bacterium]
MRTELPSGTPVELARPAGEAAGGLVVAPDIGGLRPLFDDLCARLAEENRWVVAAPEPFAGQADMPVDQRLAAAGGLDDARVLGDLRAAADLTGVERVGIVGFCMGGMYALKASGTGRFAAAVAFYGMIRVPEQWRGPAQGEPLEALGRPGRCPVLAIIGGHDHWTPPGDVDALRQVPGVEVVVYPDAEHGFAHDASRPSHRPDDAADAWGRAVAFLGGALG